MDVDLDIQPGDLYLFPQRSSKAIYEYIGVEHDDRLLFVSKSSASTFRAHREHFLQLRTTPGGAVRIRNVAPEEVNDFEYTDPATFLDPDAEGLSGRERQRIKTLRKERLWALTVQFYTVRYDETPNVKLSEKKLLKFIRANAVEAGRIGFEQQVSASTLRRAIHGCGVPGDRALHYFLPDKERHGGRFWDPFILQLKAELIDEFWAPDKPRLSDVQWAFRRKLRAKNKELLRLGADPLTHPTDETMRLWVREAECYQRYKLRHGARAAGRRFRGQSRAIQASRPLEYVMLDHTRVDAWANVEDENGTPLTQERPWLMLVVDVFSQVILAAVLTWAFPSIRTVALALKQLVRPKDFLPSNLRNFKNFGDFWGKPSFAIVDRAWENTGKSFKSICESIGINIIWAPVRTPEFKCHVEHAFHLLNSMYWHRLPSGIPHKPHKMRELGLDPKRATDRNLKRMNDGLWYAIRTHAFSDNSGLGMQPARAWREGLRSHNRKMVDDVSAFDTFLGKVVECQLSTSGIRLDNQQFHDPKITGDLLNDLLRYAKVSKQRRAPNASGTVFVHVTQHDSCESVQVWNPAKRRNVTLPNVLKKFSAGLSWEEAKAARELAAKENLEFCTEDEMIDVVAALMATYKSQAQEKPYREARKAARQYRPQAELERGTVVEEVWEDPSPTGMAARSISQTLPALERRDERKVTKDARRGGKKASKKAADARKAKKAKKEEKLASELRRTETLGTVGRSLGTGWTQVDDSAARLKRLAEVLGQAKC